MTKEARFEQSERPTWKLVTPRWRAQRRRVVDELRAAREQSSVADTTLIIPAAQHPLVEGVTPCPEFHRRLESALAIHDQIVLGGGKAAFFLPGNRHHDPHSGMTDRVALYDAAGRWLVNWGIAPKELHGKDWMDEFGKNVYNGADEISVASRGFVVNSHLQNAIYVCSPGQRSRAELYALAYGLPLDVVVPETLSTGSKDQFHAFGGAQLAATALTLTIDPYGAILARHTENRVPADGNVGTVSDLRPNYADLPWYAGTAPQ